MRTPTKFQVHTTLYTNMTSDDPWMTSDDPGTTFKNTTEYYEYTQVSSAFNFYTNMTSDDP